MGRIHRSVPNAKARQNNYRWQDDPETGEFSNYGRGRWNLLAAVFAVIGAMLMAAVVIGAIVAVASALAGR